MRSIEASDTPGDWTYRHHAVAFLDLMGQRHLFNGIHGVPSSPEEEARLLGVLKQTIGFIRAFRSGFEDMFSGYQGIRKIPDQVPPQFHAEYRRMQACEIHLQSVSDAVIAWAPVHTIDDAAGCKAMNSLWGMLIASAGMTLISLSTKHALRGGIEVDGGITIQAGASGSEIYGPALNRAYELESLVADYPRIVIGNGLVELVDAMIAASGESRFAGHVRTMAGRCKQLITKDDDGQWVLHFLGLGSKEIMELQGGVKFRADVLLPAQAFAKESAAQFKDNAKLGPRYDKLVKYFERNMPGWMT